MVREPVKTRDHTEIALRELGADITVDGHTIRIHGGQELEAKKSGGPGRPLFRSVLPGRSFDRKGSRPDHRQRGVESDSNIAARLSGVCGAVIKILDIQQVNGELIGTLQVRTSRTRGGVIEGASRPRLLTRYRCFAFWAHSARMA